MKIVLLLAAGLAFSASGVCQDSLCYTLINSTTHPVEVQYQYPGNVIPDGGAISDTFSPGAQKKYCFLDYAAQAVIVTLGTAWRGFRPMIMGNTAGALPAGNYYMVSGPAPPPPQPTPDSPIIWLINEGSKVFTNTSTDDPRATPLAACPTAPDGFTPGVYHVISALPDNPPHDLQRETNSNALTEITQRGIAQEWVEIGQYPDNCFYIKVAGGCAYIQEGSWRNSGPGPLQLGIQYFGECNNVGGANGNDEWAIYLNKGNNLYVLKSKRSSFCLDRRSQDDHQVEGAVQQNFCSDEAHQFWKLERFRDLPPTSK